MHNLTKASPLTGTINDSHLNQNKTSEQDKGNINNA